MIQAKLGLTLLSVASFTANASIPAIMHCNVNGESQAFEFDLDQKKSVLTIISALGKDEMQGELDYYNNQVNVRYLDDMENQLHFSFVFSNQKYQPHAENFAMINTQGFLFSTYSYSAQQNEGACNYVY